MASAADHRVQLADGWALWRWACLRGAGFGARGVLALASAEMTRAADAALSLSQAAETQRRAASEAVRQALETGPPEERKRWRKLVKALRTGAPLEAANDLPAAASVTEAVEADRRRDQAERAFQAGYAGWALEIRGALRGWAAEPRLREALTWQNRVVVRTVADALLAAPPETADAAARRSEAVLASYIQRYCLKNDTIGFFGPVGWLRFDGPTEIRPGSGLLATRRVYFERWCIEALAERFADSLRPWLPPRRMPSVRLEQGRLWLPDGRDVALPSEVAQVLDRCDGVRTPATIAAEVDLDRDRVLEALEALQEKKLVVWTLEIPTHDLHPEEALRRQLDSLPPEAPAEARAALDELEARRDQVAASAGDPRALDRALEAFDESFVRLAGRAATRGEGRAYAGRTLLYEDCRRDVACRLGPDVVERLAAPLSLVLESARWFTYAVAGRLEARVAAAHRALCDELGRTEVDFLRLYERLLPELDGGPAPLVREARDQLQAGWAAIVEPGERERRVARSSAALRPAVRSHFGAPHPGWPSARFHSPDLMIAAESAGALVAGRFQLVLGELHAGFNTVVTPFLLKEHPTPDELLADYLRDLPARCLSPVEPGAHASRADQFSLAPGDLQVELGATRSSRPRAQVLAAADLVVAERAGRLEVRSRDGLKVFGVAAFFQAWLQGAAGPYFQLFAPAAHSPRFTLDGLVVARETWRFPASELAFAHVDAAPARFLAARDWARRHELPRFVFVKVPEEPKPCFCDFDSAVFVELLARLVRKASALAVTEMLPTVDDCWLPDAAGTLYTCELRVAAVDPIAFPE